MFSGAHVLSGFPSWWNLDVQILEADPKVRMVLFLAPLVCPADLCELSFFTAGTHVNPK